MKKPNRTLLIQSIPASVTRLVIGSVFATTGWGKLHHLEKVIAFFDSLKIPFPGIQAPMVACIELLGGLALLLGFGTKLVSIPLIIIMSVAVATARPDDIHEFSDLFSIYEFLYAVLLLWLAVQGPGILSVDHLLNKKRISISKIFKR